MSFRFWNNLPQEFQNDITTTATIGTLLLILYYIYIRNTRKNARKNRNSIPVRKLLGPFSWPILGNACQISEGHLTFSQWAKIYGPVYRIKLGTHFAVVLNNLSVIKAAINRERDIYSGRPIFPSNKVVSFGRGIAFNDRTTMPDWQKRKGFMVKKLHVYVSSSETKLMFEQNAVTMISYLGNTVDQQARTSDSGYINPSEIIKASLGNFLCSICFGKFYSVNDSVFLRLLDNNKEFGEVAGLGNRIDTMPWIKILPKYRKTVEEFDALSYRISNWVRERCEENMSAHEPGIFKSLVDVFLHDEWTSGLTNGHHYTNGVGHFVNNMKMNRLDFIALFVDIFGAGQDTLVGAQLFVFYYMLKYPLVAKKIREELKRVVGDNKTPTIADRPNLPYVEAVIHEILRHSSISATTIPHRTLGDSVVQGYHVPSNSIVILNFYAVNFDPTMWESPETFYPERFLTITGDGLTEINRNAVNKYLVFSTGARKCPGGDITFNWLILSTAMLLQKYEFIQDPDNPATESEIVGLTLAPKPFKVKLVKRYKHSNGNGTTA